MPAGDPAGYLPSVKRLRSAQKKSKQRGHEASDVRTRNPGGLHVRSLRKPGRPFGGHRSKGGYALGHGDSDRIGNPYRPNRGRKAARRFR